jgi:hypothetical protein
LSRALVRSVMRNSRNAAFWTMSAAPLRVPDAGELDDDALVATFCTTGSCADS